MTQEQNRKQLVDSAHQLEEKLTLEQNRCLRQVTGAEEFQGFWQGSFMPSLVAFGLCTILFGPCVIADTVVATAGPAESPNWVIVLVFGVGPLLAMVIGFRFGHFWGALGGIALYAIWWSPVMHILSEDPLLRSADSVRFLDSTRFFGWLAIAGGTAISGVVGGIRGWRSARNAPEVEKEARVWSLRDKLKDLRKEIDRAKEEDLDDIGKVRDLRERLVTMTESLEPLASNARQHLNNAERHFDKRRFAPFWRAVEGAGNALYHYQRLIGEIEETGRVYNNRRANLSFTFFPNSKSELTPFRPTVPDVRAILVSLKILVRAAQSDYEFASIYENRKTNVLLNKGFANLTDAIERMSIEASSNMINVSSEIGDLSSKVGEEFRVVHGRLVTLGSEVEAGSDAIAQLESRVSSDASEARERRHQTGEKVDRVDRNVEEIMERWRARQREKGRSPTR